MSYLHCDYEIDAVTSVPAQQKNRLIKINHTIQPYSDKYRRAQRGLITESPSNELLRSTEARFVNKRSTIWLAVMHSTVSKRHKPVEGQNKMNKICLVHAALSCKGGKLFYFNKPHLKAFTSDGMDSGIYLKLVTFSCIDGWHGYCPTQQRRAIRPRTNSKLFLLARILGRVWKKRQHPHIL